MSGLFITFEGCEGSGKSTHSEKVYQTLIKKGYPVLLTHEPGGTIISDKIRELLLSKEDDGGFCNISPTTELMLYLASRAQHVEELILPALKAGKVVLCDRFSDTTFAYQGYGRDMDLESLKMMNQFITKGLRPHHTILLDVEPKVGIERSKRLKKTFASEGELDRMESQSIKFHNAVRKGYLAIVQDDSSRISVFNTLDPIEQNFNGIMERILKLIKENGISSSHRSKKS